MEVVHGMVGAFNRRDADAAWALTNGEMEFRSTLVDLQGDSGIYRGRDDVDRYFRDLDEVIEDWQIREHFCIDAGDGCVLLVYRVAGRGRGSGAPMDHEFGIVWRLQDGKLLSGDTYSDPQEAVAAAGLERLASDMHNLRAMTAAVAASDTEALKALIHPDVVWEHNLGSGSFEEGTYEGRESVVRLFERLIEPWEYMRPQTRDAFPLEDGGFLIRGDLHTKHRATAAEVVTPYEQRFQMRDGLLFRASMSFGAAEVGAHAE
jgi:ketosteroid isomerase-like protein